MGANKIRELNGIPQPRLSWLNLDANRIKSCADFNGHDNLLTLILSNNKLANCAGLAAMPKLIELNLTGNAITSLSELRGLGNLKRLEVGKNKLANFDNFPQLPELEYFDASENAIEANGEKELAKLGECEKLTTLIMAGCPWVDEKGDEFKKEVLIALEHLSIVQVNDMEPVTAEEKTEAKNEKAEREKARLEAEEEARKAAEEAANNPPEEEGQE